MSTTPAVLTATTVCPSSTTRQNSTKRSAKREASRSLSLRPDTEEPAPDRSEITDGGGSRLTGSQNSTPRHASTRGSTTPGEPSDPTGHPVMHATPTTQRRPHPCLPNTKTPSQDATPPRRPTTATVNTGSTSAATASLHHLSHGLQLPATARTQANTPMVPQAGAKPVRLSFNVTPSILASEPDLVTVKEGDTSRSVISVLRPTPPNTPYTPLEEASATSGDIDSRGGQTSLRSETATPTPSLGHRATPLMPVPLPSVGKSRLYFKPKRAHPGVRSARLQNPSTGSTSPADDGDAMSVGTDTLPDALVSVRTPITAVPDDDRVDRRCTKPPATVTTIGDAPNFLCANASPLKADSRIYDMKFHIASPNASASARGSLNVLSSASPTDLPNEGKHKSEQVTQSDGTLSLGETLVTTSASSAPRSSVGHSVPQAGGTACSGAGLPASPTQTDVTTHESVMCGSTKAEGPPDRQSSHQSTTGAAAQGIAGRCDSTATTLSCNGPTVSSDATRVMSEDTARADQASISDHHVSHNRSMSSFVPGYANLRMIHSFMTAASDACPASIMSDSACGAASDMLPRSPSVNGFMASVMATSTTSVDMNALAQCLRECHHTGQPMSSLLLSSGSRGTTSTATTQTQHNQATCHAEDTAPQPHAATGAGVPVTAKDTATSTDTHDPGASPSSGDAPPRPVTPQPPKLSRPPGNPRGSILRRRDALPAPATKAPAAPPQKRDASHSSPVASIVSCEGFSAERDGLTDSQREAPAPPALDADALTASAGATRTTQHRAAPFASSVASPLQDGVIKPRRTSTVSVQDAEETTTHAHGTSLSTRPTRTPGRLGSFASLVSGPILSATTAARRPQNTMMLPFDLPALNGHSRRTVTALPKDRGGSALCLPNEPSLHSLQSQMGITLSTASAADAVAGNGSADVWTSACLENPNGSASHISCPSPSSHSGTRSHSLTSRKLSTSSVTEAAVVNFVKDYEAYLLSLDVIPAPTQQHLQVPADRRKIMDLTSQWTASATSDGRSNASLTGSQKEAAQGGSLRRSGTADDKSDPSVTRCWSFGSHGSLSDDEDPRRRGRDASRTAADPMLLDGGMVSGDTGAEAAPGMTSDVNPIANEASGHIGNSGDEDDESTSLPQDAHRRLTCAPLTTSDEEKLAGSLTTTSEHCTGNPASPDATPACTVVPGLLQTTPVPPAGPLSILQPNSRASNVTADTNDLVSPNADCASPRSVTGLSGHSSSVTFAHNVRDVNLQGRVNPGDMNASHLPPAFSRDSIYAEADSPVANGQNTLFPVSAISSGRFPESKHSSYASARPSDRCGSVSFDFTYQLTNREASANLQHDSTWGQSQRHRNKWGNQHHGGSGRGWIAHLLSNGSPPTRPFGTPVASPHGSERSLPFSNHPSSSESAMLALRDGAFGSQYQIFLPPSQGLGGLLPTPSRTPADRSLGHGTPVQSRVNPPLQGMTGLGAPTLKDVSRDTTKDSNELLDVDFGDFGTCYSSAGSSVSGGGTARSRSRSPCESVHSTSVSSSIDGRGRGTLASLARGSKSGKPSRYFTNKTKEVRGRHHQRFRCSPADRSGSGASAVASPLGAVSPKRTGSKGKKSFLRAGSRTKSWAKVNEHAAGVSPYCPLGGNNEDWASDSTCDIEFPVPVVTTPQDGSLANGPVPSKRRVTRAAASSPSPSFTKTTVMHPQKSVRSLKATRATGTFRSTNSRSANLPQTHEHTFAPLGSSYGPGTASFLHDKDDFSRAVGNALVFLSPAANAGSLRARHGNGATVFSSALDRQESASMVSGDFFQLPESMAVTIQSGQSDGGFSTPATEDLWASSDSRVDTATGTAKGPVKRARLPVHSPPLTREPHLTGAPSALDLPPSALPTTQTPRRTTPPLLANHTAAATAVAPVHKRTPSSQHALLKKSAEANTYAMRDDDIFGVMLASVNGGVSLRPGNSRSHVSLTSSSSLSSSSSSMVGRGGLARKVYPDTAMQTPILRPAPSRTSRHHCSQVICTHPWPPHGVKQASPRRDNRSSTKQKVPRSVSGRKPASKGFATREWESPTSTALTKGRQPNAVRLEAKDAPSNPHGGPSPLPQRDPSTHLGALSTGDGLTTRGMRDEAPSTGLMFDWVGVHEMQTLGESGSSSSSLL